MLTCTCNAISQPRNVLTATFSSKQKSSNTAIALAATKGKKVDAKAVALAAKREAVPPAANQPSTGGPRHGDAEAHGFFSP